ncbi:hypothetical protein B9Z55_006612 [Caenorhabditis nigoni]|uniref:Uncharacterized protein n=1 Tax=Caenorhabditis nigoni TaxID=1611254 RepID=A0A2G5V5V0_9PELO|nr:hypothetical protein B9Z55_006612 [Caenorhabditis nigoni]
MIAVFSAQPFSNLLCDFLHFVHLLSSCSPKTKLGHHEYISLFCFQGDFNVNNAARNTSFEGSFATGTNSSTGVGGEGKRFAWNDNAYKLSNALWAKEHECSIQNRNQKVIEEAPSSFVPLEMRRKMGERAVQLAKAAGYDFASTVEFLVDSQRNFYFLEMNTRLQVEHPIVECTTGIYTVQMLRVAYGHSLPLTREQVPLNGWAFESRVYAEDPYKQFGLPSVGRLPKYVEPRHVDGVCCSSGIREGSEISIYYDPLSCKFVTHNISLVRDIAQEKRFRSGDITTKYLPEVYPERFQGTVLTHAEEKTVIAFAAALNARKIARANQLLNQNRQLSTHVASFSKTYKFVFSIPSKKGQRPTEHAVKLSFVDGDANKAKVSIGGKFIDISGNLGLSLPVNSIEVNGEHITTQIVGKRAGEITVIYKGTPFKVQVLPEQAVKYLQYMEENTKVDLSTVVLSPMPGAIKNVNVKPGDMVSEGQERVVMEAMKMQNSLHGGKTGRVKAVNVKVGATVDEGEVLVELE